MTARPLTAIVRAIDRFSEWTGIAVAWLMLPLVLVLKQVVKDWSLATIYKGMFQFMGIQVAAISLLFVFPPIATWLPDALFHSGALVVSDPATQTQNDPFTGYGDTYEQLYKRSLKNSKPVQ